MSDRDRLPQLPVFRPGILGINKRGLDAARLSDAMRDVPEAHEARVALGSPFDKQRRETALATLLSLSDHQLSRVMAAYDRKRGDA